MSEVESVTRLSNSFPERMVILDCETTGGKATFHRIIEIGLLVVDQGEVVERWQTFLNPESHLPPVIQRLTGITPDKLRSAPLFADIANELLAKLEDRVLVAHNARFDYGFLKNEFARLGIAYSTKPLCSVKLSRKLFPQYKRHSLNEIIRRFRFNIENRHRALDDAEVVWQFFCKSSALLAEDEIRSACASLLQRPALPMLLDEGEVDKLPKAPGVYYFYDARGKLLYVGKSINLRDRVMSHFTQDYRNPKDLEMSGQIAHIDFERTPSDFGAQLRESQQIKALNPIYNRRLTRVTKLYQYEMEPDVLGYLNIRICPLEQAHTDAALSAQFGLFRSRRQAENQLRKLAEHFFLCDKLCNLQSSERAENRTPCFGFQLRRCLGACCSQETPDAYNERVRLALKDYRYKAWPWPDAILVEEQGADPEETVWHLLNEWRHVCRIRTLDELYDRGYALAESEVITGMNDLQPVEAVEFDLDTYLILIRFLLNTEQMAATGLRVRQLVTV